MKNFLSFSLALRWLGALASLSAAFGAPNAFAQNEGNTLATNQSLRPGQMLRSSNKTYRAVMQGDGNFVVYGEPWRVIWASGTNSSQAANGSLSMQSDGNLCLYGPARTGIWCNYSNGAEGDYFLMLRDSGDLEVYRGSFSKAAAAALIWTTALDASYYANRYADVRQALGTEPRRLMDHWITYGRFEGRSPKAGVSDDGFVHARNVKLDSVFYANKYPDLKQAFGYDAEKLYQHWMNFGRREGRVPNKETEAYLAAPARSANGLSSMRNVDWLHTNESLRSPNGRYIAILQGDFNFVIYEGGISANGHRWNYGQVASPGPGVVRMQTDGHFCVYRGTVKEQGQGIRCVPARPDAPSGRYFLTLQDDGNLVIYKGGGPNDNRGWVWDRLTTTPSTGFNFGAVAETIASVTVSTANSIGSGAVNTANVVAAGTVNTANAIGNEIVKTANKTVNDIVNTANLVADTSEKVAVQTGASIEAGGKVIGEEIVINGKIVGYAVAKAATDAWNLLNANCGVIGRTAFPLPQTAYFRGADQLSSLFMNSSVVDPKTRAAFRDVNAANAEAATCFSQMQDGFYCAMPKEMAKLVVESGQIPGNLLNLGTRVFNEAKTEQCLIVGAATVTFGALGLQMCAFGKVVVTDTQKAIACFSAAESKGVMKKFFTPGAASHAWPSKEACEGVGALALVAAKTVLTSNLSSQAKAATKAGKSNTLAQVAEELRTLYSVAAAGASYDAIVRELEALPECKQ